MDSFHLKNWENSINDSFIAAREQRHSCFERSVRKKDLAVYTRQMATLLKAGIPVVQALQVLLRQERSGVMARIVKHQIAEIEGGNPLSASMRRFPHVFNSMYVNLVSAGEKAGVLDQVMIRLAHYLEKTLQTWGKIRTAMTYPMVVLLASMGIVAGLLIVVIPQFETIFETMLQGASLPRMTQWVLNISRVSQQYGFYMIAGIVSIGVILRLLIGLSLVRTILHQIQLAFPVLGEILKKSLLARFCRTLSVLRDSAVPILDAIETASKTMNNEVLEQIFDRVRDRLIEGDTLAKSLESEKTIPPIIVGMIEVGEATGDLPAMLRQISDTYEQEVNVSIDGVTTLIEPIMILVLALIIGFLVISLFLPIVEIMEHLGV